METSGGLSPEAWAEGALTLIAESGVEALNVEALARRLKVTKGSFYWHFSSRDALLLVALARWERLQEEHLRAALGAIPEGRARLRRLLWRGGDPLLSRFLETSDENVRRALERVRDRHLAMLVESFASLGLNHATARRRALLAEAAFIGQSHLDPAAAEVVTEQLLAEV